MLHEMATQTQRQQLGTPHHECSKHADAHTHTISAAVVDSFGSLRFISSLLTAGTHCLSSAVCFAITVKQGGLQRDQNNLSFSHRL